MYLFFLLSGSSVCNGYIVVCGLCQVARSHHAVESSCSLVVHVNQCSPGGAHLLIISATLEVHASS